MKALTLKRNFKLPFRAGELWVYEGSDGAVGIDIEPICRRLGIGYAAERERILRQRCFADNTWTTSVDVNGVRRPCFFLDKDCVPGWLQGIDESRCASQQARDALYLYQTEGIDALRRYYSEGIAINPRVPISPAQIVQQMAQVLVEQEQKILEHDQRLREQEQRGIETHLRIEHVEGTAKAALGRQEGNHGMYTIVAFWGWNGVHLDHYQANMIGQHLSRRCRERGIRLGRRRHAGYAKENTYPEAALKEYFDEFNGTGSWWPGDTRAF